MPKPGIYLGVLNHRRFTPTPHEFDVPLFMVLLDVDRIPEMMRASRLASHNRFNWASFCDRDHFGDASLPLRRRLELDAAGQGITLPDGPVFLLTHLRYLGYNFNPVSFFFCYDLEGRLAVVLAEVNNTFGETRNYWLGPRNEVEGGRLRRFRADKAMHVSPFMPMEMEYTFGFSEPDDELTVYMNTIDRGAMTFDATLRMKFREWTAANLRRALVRHPWMTMKVVLGIHWQALVLLLKKVPVFTHPTGRDWKVW
jgi:uncharacterized protein